MPYPRLALLGAALLLTHCGKTTSGPTVIATELEGTWQTACRPHGSDPSERFSYTFTAMDYRFDARLYSDAACTRKIAVLSAAGTFTRGSAAILAGATKIDYLQSGLTIQTSNGGAALLGPTVCTGVTLVDDTVVDLAGRSCAGDVQQKNGSTWFDVYILGGTTMQPGRSSGPTSFPAEGALGSDDAHRPSSAVVEFTKQ